MYVSMQVSVSLCVCMHIYVYAYCTRQNIGKDQVAILDKVPNI